MSVPSAFVSSFTAGTTLRSRHKAMNTRNATSLPQRRSAVPNMLLDLITLPWQKSDTVALPQDDNENSAARANAIKEARTNYMWDHSAIEGASMMKGLPDGENPSFGWIELLIPVLLRVAVNAALVNANDFVENLTANIASKLAECYTTFASKLVTNSFEAKDVKTLSDIVSPLLEARSDGKGEQLEDYLDLYQNINVDKVAKCDQFLFDDMFGWLRVAGPNPMKLTRLGTPLRDLFPDLTDEILHGIQSFDGDSLASLENEKRLFFVTYPEFENVPTGSLPDGVKKGSFLYAPTCLLAIPKSPVHRETVLPLAIYTGQDRNNHPMYTANPSHTDPVTWLASKLTIQVADAVIHETVFHLARTHLLLGIAVCSTHRALAPQHPVHRLLSCHFYGTAFINYLATETLINPGGTIDQITGPDILVTQGVAAKGINDAQSRFNDWFPDIDLVNRGVMSSKLKYPYRDDALGHWNALLDFVRSYITAYYKSDADVQADPELAAWCVEMTAKDCGNLHGFGDKSDGKIVTIEYLIRTVAMLIFSGTVQHAAVNYPQSTIMQHAPAMPLGGYAPPPTTSKPFDTLDHFVEEMMPPVNLAEKQLVTAELIGVLKYGEFGEYGRDLEFAPEQVDDALDRYQDALGALATKISERVKVDKAHGLPHYHHLHPTRIPKSINI